MRGDKTLWWNAGALELIDQRRLPRECVTLRCTTAAEVAAAIQEMAVRGAPAIGCAAAFGLALSARQHAAAGLIAQRAALAQDAARLRATRPTAVNLAWALDRQLALATTYPGADAHALAGQLLAAAETIAADDEAACRAMGAHGAALLAPGSRVLTHCNAGSLATAAYGTALGVVRTAYAQGRVRHVLVDETRPRLQGARLTAWELQQAGIPCTLIADNMAATFMRQGAVDAVLVGADRIAANGDTANKIGTYGLAVLARAHAIPLYVVAPASTVDLALPDGTAIPIEERAAAELTHLGGEQLAPAGIAVANPAFDVTPWALITAIVTEHGVIDPPFAAGLRATVAASPLTHPGVALHAVTASGA
ncbi:MAG TPA: S-methyl-5-thioribose-1-phosphate isomerase [Chloroflexia bacterium]|nr:S-methyl-5-thioribose-1-phosphate isomerase [Chloroflexia bacterium]